MKNSGKFEDMLDMLMDEYPNLQKEAMALKDSLAAEGGALGEEEDMMAPESEEPAMPGAFKAIPPELEDEEAEEGEEEEDTEDEEESPLF